uniref:Uncharacterized protein n=1 Tax=Oryza nivara TaxID=4536 RepID=A0A0E0G301_ORYNI
MDGGKVRSVPVPPDTKILAVGSGPIQRLVEFGTRRYQFYPYPVPHKELSNQIGRDGRAARTLEAAGFSIAVATSWIDAADSWR